MKIAYVAGPYRGDVETNVAKARMVSGLLCLMGYAVVCPHMNTHNMDFHTGLPDDYWLKATMSLMEKCDLVVLVPGWENSLGTQAEVDRAMLLGIPVHHLGEVKNA